MRHRCKDQTNGNQTPNILATVLLKDQLWENDISGTLPTQFGRLTAGGKMTISLDGNSFSGTLPSELGNWQSGDNMFLWMYGN